MRCESLFSVTYIENKGCRRLGTLFFVGIFEKTRDHNFGLCILLANLVWIQKKR